MYISVFLVVTVLLRLSYGQDEVASETETGSNAVPPEMMKPEIGIFNAEVLAVDSEPATDVICASCACAQAEVDCRGAGIRTPFTGGDWNGLLPLNISSVDLSGNAIGSVKIISSLPIQSLNLSNCDIEYIEEDAFANLVELVSLDLSRNKLSTASLTMRVFGSRMVPGQRPQLFFKMRYLSLAYNDIHSLPSDIFISMIGMTSLDLSGNPLAFIDQVTMASLSQLTKLEELRLSGCELETLPDGLFRRQRRITRLTLSDNRFTTVPAVLNEATNLIYLKLDKNSFTNLDEKTAITNLTSLQELHLSRLSKLQSIGAGALGGLENLVTLYITFNPRLTTIDPGFLHWLDDHEQDRYPMIKKLHLNNNNISEINSHFLERWDLLEDTDFSNNPYNCDCSNQWMVDVLTPLINDSATNMHCKKPAEMRGLSFYQLHTQNKLLTCPSVEKMLDVEGPDMAILLGIMIGIFVTFPLVLVIVLLWRKGYFAKCRGRKDTDYSSEDEKL